MRSLLLAVLASGCSLYFGPSSNQNGGGGGGLGGGSAPPPDSQPGPDVMLRCEDGSIYAVDLPEFASTTPGHGAGTFVAQCPGACQSSSVFGMSNISWLCTAFPSNGKPCELDGQACQGSETVACPQASACGESLPGSSCTCTNGSYKCTQSTPAASIQQALVGKWSGTVTGPSFAGTYQVSLWIYPDGTYWPESSSQYDTVFYYGGDGPHPDRKISVLSTSQAQGAWADIGIYFGNSPPNLGAIQGLTVAPTTLRFTYYAAWDQCTSDRMFTYVLSRVP